MSGMLGFDELDNGECDETTEEDLRILSDNDSNFALADKIKDFLEGIAKSDPVYLSQCYSKLKPKDQKAFKNDLKLSLPGI